MNKLLIINIKELLQAGEEIVLKRGVEMENVDCIENAFVYATDGKIASYGEMKNLPAELEMLVKAWNSADRRLLGRSCRWSGLAGGNVS